MTESLWLTAAELAERLNGVPEETLAYWRRIGKGPRYARFGRHVRYRASDVAAWEEQMVGGDAA